jgi:hypothetical protein
MGLKDIYQLGTALSFLHDLPKPNFVQSVSVPISLADAPLRPLPAPATLATNP